MTIEETEHAREKCKPCYRKNECMLWSDLPAAIINCLGPYKNPNHWLQVYQDSHKKKGK